MSEGSPFFKNPKTYVALFAEFLGTFILLFVGVGAGTMVEGASSVHGPIAAGLIIASIVQTFGHVSGANINPTVTAALMATRKLHAGVGLLYVVVQVLGAMSGTIMLRLLTPTDKLHPDFAVNLVAEGVSPVAACVMEFITSFIFVLTIFGVIDEKRVDLKGSGALAIGLVVTALALLSGPYTGCSLNPARSFGPALFAGNWKDHWVYWIGPIFGGIAGGLVYQGVFRAHKPTQRPEPKARGDHHEYEMCDTK